MAEVDTTMLRELLATTKATKCLPDTNARCPGCETAREWREALDVNAEALLDAAEERDALRVAEAAWAKVYAMSPQTPQWSSTETRLSTALHAALARAESAEAEARRLRGVLQHLLDQHVPFWACEIIRAAITAGDGPGKGE